jgi:hypothetical protein
MDERELAHWESTAMVWRRPARLGEQYLRRPERVAVADYYLGVIDVMQWIPDDHELAGQSVAAIYGFLTEKYLRPRSHIKAAVDAFHQRYIAGTPTIAVHVRGLDKKCEEPELYAINARYFDILDEEDPSWRILLLTDDEIWAGAFRKTERDMVSAWS